MDNAVVTLKNQAVAKHVLMVPPHGFCFNEQTALSNHYQKKPPFYQHKNVMSEFYNMVDSLITNNIAVTLLKQDKSLPDAVFPNNWFSTHIDENGKTLLIIYPMLTPNRQQEVVKDKLIDTFKKNHIHIDKVVDLRVYQQVLEGTGSLVLDRQNKIIYAALSERTTAFMVDKVAKILNYKAITFTSHDKNNNAIYHTNVMMGLSEHLAIICLDSIKDKKEKNTLIKSLIQSGKEIIAINETQVNTMCANVLALENKQGDAVLVLSQQAYTHLNSTQKKQMEKLSMLLPVDITTIETIGGGSARCMMAEIFY